MLDRSYSWNLQTTSLNGLHKFYMDILLGMYLYVCIAELYGLFVEHRVLRLSHKNVYLFSVSFSVQSRYIYMYILADHTTVFTVL